MSLRARSVRSQLVRSGIVLVLVWAGAVAVWHVPTVSPVPAQAETWSVDGSVDAHLAWTDVASGSTGSIVVRARNPVAQTWFGRLTLAPNSLYMLADVDAAWRLRSVKAAASGAGSLIMARSMAAWVGLTLDEISQRAAAVSGHQGSRFGAAGGEALSLAARAVVQGSSTDAVVPVVGLPHAPFEVLDWEGSWITEMIAKPGGCLLLEVGPYCGQCLDALDMVVGFLSSHAGTRLRLVVLVKGRPPDVAGLTRRAAGQRVDYALDPHGALSRELLGSDSTAWCVLVDARGITRFAGSALDRSNALLETLSAQQP